MDNLQYEETLDAVEEPHNTWTFLDVLLIGLSSAAMVLFGAYLLSRIANINLIDPSQEQPSLLFNSGLAAMEGIALITSVYIFGIRRRHLSWQEIGMRPASQGWFVGAVVTSLLFIPIIALVALLIQLSLGMPYENPQLEFILPVNFSWIGAISMLLLGGFLVPIAEEIFFRGVLYQWMRDRLGVWIAIPGSALIFGLLHGEISVAGATFVMGLILAWFYERSNSLWPSIIIHIVNNSLKLLLLYTLIALGITYPGF